MLANPQSGGGVAADAVTALRAGAEVELVHPEGEADIRAALLRAGGRQVVVVGGDGTVHAVAQCLSDLRLLSEVGPIALIPAGTGNDLARSLGLPLDDVHQAVRLAMTSHARHLEILRDDEGGVVVNAVHVGVGAKAGSIAADVKEPLAKIGIGKAAYPVGALAAGVTGGGHRLRVTLDGEVLHDGAVPTLLVAAGVGTSVGGGTPLSPDADPFDGVMDVTVSTATGPLTRFGYAASIRAGTHVDRDDTITARGRELTIESVDGESFLANADGEISRPLLRRTWTVVPRAWCVVVPPHL